MAGMGKRCVILRPTWLVHLTILLMPRTQCIAPHQNTGKPWRKPRVIGRGFEWTSDGKGWMNGWKEAEEEKDEKDEKEEKEMERMRGSRKKRRREERRGEEIRER